MLGVVEANNLDRATVARRGEVRLCLRIGRCFSEATGNLNAGDLREMRGSKKEDIRPARRVAGA